MVIMMAWSFKGTNGSALMCFSFISSSISVCIFSAHSYARKMHGIQNPPNISTYQHILGYRFEAP